MGADRQDGGPETSADPRRDDEAPNQYRDREGAVHDQAIREPGTTAAATGQALSRYLHTPTTPLTECLGSFWDLAAPLDDIPGAVPAAIEPMEILKRLGPSPFDSARFPLIGFLASTYDRVGQMARQRANPE